MIQSSNYYNSVNVQAIEKIFFNKMLVRHSSIKKKDHQLKKIFLDLWHYFMRHNHHKCYEYNNNFCDDID